MKKHNLERKKKKSFCSNIWLYQHEPNQIHVHALLWPCNVLSKFHKISICVKGKVLQWKIEHDGRAQKNNAHKVLAQNPLCSTTLPLLKEYYTFYVFHPLLNVRCLDSASLRASAISLQKYAAIIPQFSTALCFFPINRIPHISSRIRQSLGKLVRTEKWGCFLCLFIKVLSFKHG